MMKVRIIIIATLITLCIATENIPSLNESKDYITRDESINSPQNFKGIHSEAAYASLRSRNYQKHLNENDQEQPNYFMARQNQYLPNYQISNANNESPENVDGKYEPRGNYNANNYYSRFSPTVNNKPSSNYPQTNIDAYYQQPTIYHKPPLYKVMDSEQYPDTSYIHEHYIHPHYMVNPMVGVAYSSAPDVAHMVFDGFGIKYHYK